MIVLYQRAAINHTPCWSPQEGRVFLAKFTLAMLARVRIGGLRVADCYSNAKMRFQSFFMLTTIQPSFAAKS